MSGRRLRTYGCDSGTDEVEREEAHKPNELTNEGGDAAIVVASMEDMDSAYTETHTRAWAS